MSSQRGHLFSFQEQAGNCTMYLLLHAFTTWADTFQHPMCCPHCPQLSASPLLTPTPPAGSPGRNTLLPNVSLQSFQPECYRETLETRLRAEIIANIELCLIKNINFTMFPFSPQKYTYSQHLQHTTRSSSWKHMSSWHKNFPFLLNVIST